MRADQILDALACRYRAPEWAFFRELRCGTGYDYTWAGNPSRVQKRLDAWAFHLWPSGGYQPTGFEVKVSRADFLHDVRNGSKRGRYMELCQFFYYVTPSGLVDVSEVPEEAGFITVNSEGRTRIVKHAPRRECPEPEWDFFAAICRRVGEAWFKPPWCAHEWRGRVECVKCGGVKR
jgi:hypothetical protein